MELGFVQHVGKITTANRWGLKSIRAVQHHIHSGKVAAHCETGQAVDLEGLRPITALLRTENHEPQDLTTDATDGMFQVSGFKF